MNQDQAILLAFKVTEIASVVAIATFVACYTRWASWFRNPIGRTIVIKDIALILVLIPSILSIFINFNRLTSHIAAWFDVGSFALVPIIMCWRIAVFRRIHKEGREVAGEDRDDGGLSMLRRATWRSWALPGALLAVFIIVGLTWNPGGSVDIWIFKTGTAGATFAPLVLTGIYSASGNKWWRFDLGTALVQSLLSIVVIVAPLAWAAWRDHGSITGGLVAWLEIAGPLLAALTILRLCWVFLRIHRDGNGSNGGP